MAVLTEPGAIALTFILYRAHSNARDLVNMLTEMGIETGVDLDALLKVSEMVQEVIPHPLDSAIVKSGKPWVLQKAPERQEKIT